MGYHPKYQASYQPENTRGPYVSLPKAVKVDTWLDAYILYFIVSGSPGPATHIQKGGRMIVLQIKKSPFSLIFTYEKKTPFFQKR